MTAPFHILSNSLFINQPIEDDCLGCCALMMEPVSTFETTANFYETTRRNIPEDSHLPARSRENLKSH
jgi:hypothetical protein